MEKQEAIHNNSLTDRSINIKLIQWNTRHSLNQSTWTSTSLVSLPRFNFQSTINWRNLRYSNKKTRMCKIIRWMLIRRRAPNCMITFKTKWMTFIPQSALSRFVRLRKCTKRVWKVRGLEEVWTISSLLMLKKSQKIPSNIQKQTIVSNHNLSAKVLFMTRVKATEALKTSQTQVLVTRLNTCSKNNQLRKSSVTTLSNRTTNSLGSIS